MFGLKIVKKEDYSVLEYQLERAQTLLDNKDCEIKTLTSRVQDLENEVKCLMKKLSDHLDSAEESKQENVVLLSDVAETPLVEEKPVKKTRKTVKKPEGTVKTPRKRVVHKTEE